MIKKTSQITRITNRVKKSQRHNDKGSVMLYKLLAMVGGKGEVFVGVFAGGVWVVICVCRWRCTYLSGLWLLVRICNIFGVSAVICARVYSHLSGVYDYHFMGTCVLCVFCICRHWCGVWVSVWYRCRGMRVCVHVACMQAFVGCWVLSNRVM